MRSLAPALILLAALGLPAQAKPKDDRPHLCDRGERVVFSCAVGRKVVSLCGSADLSKEAGTLQYRFGRRGAVEMRHPEKPAHPREAFTLGTELMGRGGGSFYRFTRGDHTYSLYALIFSGTGDVQGLIVHRGDRRLSDTRCRDFGISTEDMLFLDGLGLPKPERQLFIEDE